MKLKIDNHFWIRVPYYPYTVYTDILSRVNNMGLKKIIEELNFEEVLITSSNELYEAVYSQPNNSDSFQPCLKYLIRSATRCTPYGLNSAIVCGEFGDNTNQFINSKFHKYARADMDWLVEIIKKCEKILGSKLKVTLNNTLNYNEITVEKMWTSYYGTKSNIGGKTIINYTKAIKMIFSRCDGQYVAISDIIELLLNEYSDMKFEYLFNFLENLIDKEFVISNIRPCLLIPNQFKFLIESLNDYGIEDEYFEILKTIYLEITNYNTEVVGKGKGKYSQLTNMMSKIYKCKNYISLDMYQQDRFIMDRNVLDTDILEEFSEFMVSWGLRETYNEYIDKFIEKYGNQAIKYVDVIDPELGLGIPKVDNKNTMALNDELNNAFLDIIFKQGNSNCIDISTMKNKKFVYDSEPLLFQIAVYPFVDNGNSCFLISPLRGAKGAGKIEGRFRYIFDKEKEILNQEENSIDVEITYPACISRHANIQLTTSDTKYILEYGSETKNTFFQHIKLDDIAIFVNEYRKLNFMDIKSGKILNFQISNAYNLTYCPPILKTLLDITEKQTNAIFTLYDQLMHIVSAIDGKCPRIVYKNIVIIPASWKIDSRFFNKNGKIIDFEKFKFYFKIFKKENSVADVISIGPFDQKMILNITNIEHLKILYSMLKRQHTLPIFENVIDEKMLLLLNSDMSPYLGEFIFTMSSNTKTSNVKLNSFDIQQNNFSDQFEHTFLPFNSWISLKLYMRHSTHNNVIINQIYSLHDLLMSEEIIEKFFYIRYRDPKEHLRIRIKMKEDYISNTFMIIYDFINLLKRKKVITNCVIDAYEQEYTRYGGIDKIAFAEDFFMFDSIISINLLRAQKNKIITLDSFDLYIISSYKVLLDLKLDLEEQIDYLSDYVLDKNLSNNFKKYNSVNYLQKIIDSSMLVLCDTQEGTEISIILEERSRSAMSYWKTIEKANLDISRRKTIVCSLLHMSFNRMIGLDREQENKAIAYLRKLLFIKFNKIKHMGIEEKKNEKL